jgi:oxygen-independent coproporphyrinogen-3 oxidase
MQNLGIYVQVPFCPSKCSFCNFSSRVARPRLIADYALALHKEIDGLFDFIHPHKISLEFLQQPVETVYAGGGTPSLLGAETLAGLIGKLRERFSLQGLAEFTVEVTPASADLDFLSQARKSGVNRLSVGAQSFIDSELSSVGRLHTAEETRQQVAIARQVGFSNIGLDLIAGLPYQTPESWKQSLEQTVRLRPWHVSVYLFEIDERSRLGSELIRHGERCRAANVPNEDFMAEAYERAQEFLAAEGYQQYELSNFALPGCESIHNRKYWRMEPYLGIGAGAHSFDGVRRWSNEVSPEAYMERLESNELPFGTWHELACQELIEESLFLGLRQMEGLKLEPLAGRWPEWLKGEWRLRIEKLVAANLLEIQEGKIRLQKQAYLISNEVFQEFLVG